MSNDDYTRGDFVDSEIAASGARFQSDLSRTQERARELYYAIHEDLEKEHTKRLTDFEMHRVTLMAEALAGVDTIDVKSNCLNKDDAFSRDHWKLVRMALPEAPVCLLHVANSFHSVMSCSFRI
jgi:hypothetical protein